MNFALLFMSFTNSTWNFTHKINDISWWCWCCIIWTCFQSQLQHCAWVLEISLFWCWHLGPRPAGVSAVETNGSKPVRCMLRIMTCKAVLHKCGKLSELLAHVWLDMASSYLEVHKHIVAKLLASSSCFHSPNNIRLPWSLVIVVFLFYEKMPQVTIEKVAFLRLESTRGHRKRSLILMATYHPFHSWISYNIIIRIYNII